MEIRDSLTQYGFDGENTPIVIGSALCALEVKHIDYYFTFYDKMCQISFFVQHLITSK